MRVTRQSAKWAVGAAGGRSCCLSSPLLRAPTSRASLEAPPDGLVERAGPGR